MNKAELKGRLDALQAENRKERDRVLALSMVLDAVLETLKLEAA